jgi:hypothetical protein
LESAALLLPTVTLQNVGTAPVKVRSAAAAGVHKSPLIAAMEINLLNILIVLYSTLLWLMSQLDSLELKAFMR